MRMEERQYWLGFSVFPGIGPITFQKLLQYFGSAKAAWGSTVSELEQAGMGKVLAKKFDLFRSQFSLSHYGKKLKEKHASFLILTDNEYPKLLAQSKNPPFILYIKGTFRFNDLNHLSTVGVVGTRKITSYGREVTQLLTNELVQAGCAIVSGLAFGVDAVAHKSAIDSGGKTIAVLGSGIDICHPTTNLPLYNSIIQGHGAIVSEYPLGEPPSKGSFPSRNRIIAGLSQAVVVTEGAEDSGALITASNAASLQRPVFAVPGPITSRLSKGPFKLLQKGAKLVTSAEDILDELGLKGVKRDKGDKRVRGDTPEEQKIIDLLQNESLHFDEIVRKTGLHSANLSVLLSMMEMKGLIKSLDSHTFSL